MKTQFFCFDAKNVLFSGPVYSYPN